MIMPLFRQMPNEWQPSFGTGLHRAVSRDDVA